MAEHTPGPWRSNRERFIKAENGWTVAQVRGPSGRGEDFAEGLPFCEANARLIAAAPELLEACERMIPLNLCLTNRHIGDDTIVPIDATMRDLRAVAAVIAKARGQ